MINAIVQYKMIAARLIAKTYRDTWEHGKYVTITYSNIIIKHLFFKKNPRLLG